MRDLIAPSVHDREDTGKLTNHAGTGPASERVANSPRAAVAFSALSAVDGLRRMLRCIVRRGILRRGILRRIRAGRASSKAARKRPAAFVVKRVIHCGVVLFLFSGGRGDLLVTSSRPGYAMKGTDRKKMLGAVVGKALEPLAEGSGMIEVLVTLQ